MRALEKTAPSKNRQRGFTLVELAVVIAVVVLVIYAGLPHFQRALQEANATAVSLNGRALLDGVRAAKMMADVQGLHGEVYDLPRYGNGKVDLSLGGFPAGTSRKPGDRLSSRYCAEIWNSVTQPNPEQEGAVAEESFVPAVEKTGKTAICHYAYRRDERLAITYDPATGAVKIYSGAR